MLADSSLYLLWSDRFYPVDFDDWAVVATQLEVPRGFRVFAPGRRVFAADRGALHVERYLTSEPIRAASVIADTRWVEAERTIAGRRMRTLLHPASRAYAEQIFRTSADVLGFYASRFGRYAYDEFTFATVDGIFARRAVTNRHFLRPSQPPRPGAGRPLGAPRRSPGARATSGGADAVPAPASQAVGGRWAATIGTPGHPNGPPSQGPGTTGEGERLRSEWVSAVGAVVDSATVVTARAPGLDGRGSGR